MSKVQIEGALRCIANFMPYIFPIIGLGTVAVFLVAVLRMSFQ